MTNVFALQDEVTVAVVSAIRPKLFQTEIGMVTRRRPENLTAYDFCLRAIQQNYLSTREGVAEAIRLAHRALELDPRFGLVTVFAGICHMQNVIRGYANDPQFDRKEAVRLLRLALSLDDGDPDVLVDAAVISAFMVGDSESAIEMADRAVALNPNSYRTWSRRGQVYGVARTAFLPGIKHGICHRFTPNDQLSAHAAARRRFAVFRPCRFRTQRTFSRQMTFGLENHRYPPCHWVRRLSS